MNAKELAAWKQDRRGHEGTPTEATITATDLANLIGCGFGDHRDVYRNKIEGHEITPTKQMRMGLMTEGVNAEYYAERFPDSSLEKPGFVRSKSMPWIGATCDRIRHLGKFRRNVELKYLSVKFGHEWGQEGTDQIPLKYIVQATWQMAVLFDACLITDIAGDGEGVVSDVSALCGSGEHRVYTVPYDDNLATMLIEVATDFRNEFLLPKKLPPLDWKHPLCVKVVDTAAPIIVGDSVELPAEAGPLLEQYAEYHEIEKRAGDKKDHLKELLEPMMGTASKARFGRYSLSRYETKAKIVPERFQEAFTTFKVNLPRTKKGE